MSEQARDLGERALEERSRTLFHESVDGLDLRVRSRLTQARYSALEAAGRGAPRSALRLNPFWAPAAGVTAMAVLAMALWFGTPLGQHPLPADPQANLEDLDLVAAGDGGTGDAPLEMLQDDIDFYAWADKAAGSEPAA